VGEGHEYAASLRVHSDVLRLSELVERLGHPTRSHDIGDLVSSKNPASNRRIHSYWGLDADGNRRAPMEGLIGELLDFGEAHAEVLAALRPQCSIDLFCGIFSAEAQGGFELSPELMRRAASLNLRIGFDIY